MIKSVCDALVNNDISSAENKLRDLKIDFPKVINRMNIPIQKQLDVFYRDHFTCRYCGKRTVYQSMLRFISYKYPAEFPHHPNWKWDETHPTYYELATSCDHKKPVDCGGDNDIENLVTSCYKCNSMKSNWTLEELKENGWKLKDINNSGWDGLITQFLQLMEKTEINDELVKNSLKKSQNEILQFLAKKKSKLD